MQKSYLDLDLLILINSDPRLVFFVWVQVFFQKGSSTK